MKTLKIVVPMIVAALTIPAVDARAQAPADPTLLYACYIPGLGVTYRIKEGTLPSACVSPKHVEFSWNQQGSKGDKGDRGDKGEQGDAGLGLVPKECPSNTFLTGFTAAGGMICRNASWEVAPPPPPPPPPSVPPSAFDGVYSITPAVSKSCSGLAGTILSFLVGNLTGFEVRRVSESELQIVPRIGGTMIQFMIDAVADQLRVPYVNQIPGNIDVSATNPIEQFPFAGTGSLTFKGSLTGPTTFEGSFSASISGTVTTQFGDVAGACSVSSTSFVATRTGA